MRVITAIFVLLLLPAAALGQDRLAILGLHGTDANGHPTAEFIEAAAAGTAVAPPQRVTSLPMHSAFSHELVSMAGARYVAWLARVDSPFSGCQEYVAIFDRRSGTARVVPNIVLRPCDIAKLVADPRRPRLFVHTWTTARGLPGTIATIDEDLTVRPLVVSRRLGTAFAYAPDVDQLFVTYLGTIEDPQLSVAVFSASTGALINVFPARDARNVSTAQMQVTRDGRRLFLWTVWSALLPREQPIRAFDATTGVEIAASPPIYLDNKGDKFVLDERRNLILAPHVNYEPPYGNQVLAFDAMALGLLGGTGQYYRSSLTFQPLRGRGTAAAYLLVGAGESLGNCRVWVDAFDGSGALGTRADVPQVANSWCTAAGIILSPPDAPSGLAISVDGRRVTLTWADPGDTSDFELEAGLASGRRDVAIRVGRVTEFSVDDVPAGTYYVRVRAINEIGASAVSNEVRVVVN